MSTPRLFLAGLFAALAVIPSFAAAAPVNFVIDPAASRVTLTGTFQGHALAPPAAGSDTAAYTGTFEGDLSDGKLRLESTVPRSVPFPTPLRPGYPDLGSTQEASYGFTFETPQGTADASIRGLQLYFGNPYSPPMDVSGGTFVPADAGFFVEGGGLDVALPGAQRVFEVDLHGNGAPNAAAGPGTLTTAGNVQTLTIPLSSTFTVSSADLTLSLNGQIVATRVVPEPGGVALAIASLALLVCRRHLRRPSVA